MESLSKSRLGKGLNALIPQSKNENTNIFEVELKKIRSNPLQPRKNFELSKIDELAASIKENGILQPIIVKEITDVEYEYEIVAGERRYRAASKLNMEKIPVIIRNVAEDKSLELAIIENVQREDLNPIEEAEAYKMLLEKYNYTQEELARKLGKNRATITNTMRLLKLPSEVKQNLISGNLSSGHARAVLALENKNEQMEITEKIIEKNMSVREVEEIVQERKRKKKIVRSENRKVEILTAEGKLREYLGTKVKILDSKNDKGKIEIEYYSIGDLDRILETIGMKK